jgi:hypothetical protein
MGTFVISVTIVSWFGWLCEHGGGVPECIRFQALFSTMLLWTYLFLICLRLSDQSISVSVTANIKSLPVHIRDIYLTF